jgi:hypothetical protein
MKQNMFLSILFTDCSVVWCNISPSFHFTRRAIGFPKVESIASDLICMQFWPGVDGIAWSVILFSLPARRLLGLLFLATSSLSDFIISFFYFCEGRSLNEGKTAQPSFSVRDTRDTFKIETENPQVDDGPCSR